MPFSDFNCVAEMTRTTSKPLTRRSLLAGLSASVLGTAAHANSGQGTTADASPSFSPAGPDAKRYGEADGYPASVPWRLYQPGDPPDLYRVGAYSRFDTIHPTSRIARSTSTSTLRRAPTELRYTIRGVSSTLEDYMTRNPVTGLLVAQDDRILFERYQYGRTDADRFNSGSMAKSITGLLVGIAVGEGAIKSVDDPAEAYVPGFAGTEYGKTPLRDLLHMASGVYFGEQADGDRDLDHLWNDMVIGGFLTRKGTVGSVIQFNRRIAPPGTKFYYASIEAEVLGLVLRHAVGRSASDYLHEKLWEQIGAEADARWLIDAEGIEYAISFFNATLRDYARLGRLLANDGLWDGRAIVPQSWMLEATTVRPSDGFLAPGRATRRMGYGYLLWLFPGPRRQFAFLGDPGQRILVDPGSKLILAQTAVGSTDEMWDLWSSLAAQFASG